MARSREERRDLTERKMRSRRKKMISVFGIPSEEIRKTMLKPEHTLDKEPIGKFRNNNIANEYAGHGVSVKTNHRKGHSTHRAKLGAYGRAMNWKPHDQRQLDIEKDELEEIERNE